MKRALVLGGGGAKGAFELGALQYIRDMQPAFFNFQIIAGVSVGSLNGVMLAQNKFRELENIWNEITDEKVYTGHMPKGIFQYFGLALKVLFGRRSILGVGPLTSLVKQHVDIAHVQVDFRCGFVSLITGEYIPCRHTQFGMDNDNFQKAILGSSSMPIIWPPVEQVKIGEKLYKDVVDGGVRNLSPLKDVILDDPDEIVIINSNAQNLAEDPGAGKNIFRIADRSLQDIAMNEIFRGDIEEFIKTNEIVRQCKEKGIPVYRDKEQKEQYEYFNSIIIEPAVGLGNPLDFSTQRITQIREAGWKAAEAAFAQYEPARGFATVRSYKSVGVKR
ncbi:MAG TPA: patatin-like phospholipase family protein [Chitinophagaceae bacterium]|nr:patatin-like phospholipase family protein [Chitinophagaceae bacterium]